MLAWFLNTEHKWKITLHLLHLFSQESYMYRSQTQLHTHKTNKTSQFLAAENINRNVCGVTDCQKQTTRNQNRSELAGAPPNTRSSTGKD